MRMPIVALISRARDATGHVDARKLTMMYEQLIMLATVTRWIAEVVSGARSN